MGVGEDVMKDILERMQFDRMIGDVELCRIAVCGQIAYDLANTGTMEQAYDWCSVSATALFGPYDMDMQNGVRAEKGWTRSFEECFNHFVEENRLVIEYLVGLFNATRDWALEDDRERAAEEAMKGRD